MYESARRRACPQPSSLHVVIVSDSNAILLYLAEKTGKFLPSNTPMHRAELLS